jgi:hypothetical protein
MPLVSSHTTCGAPFARLRRETSYILRPYRAQYHCLRRVAKAVLGSLFVFYIASACAYADVDVQGDIASMRITANHTPIAEALSALGPTLHVGYRASIPLEGTINGTYAGSLGQVLERILNGYNYVIRKEGDVIELIVIGRTGDRAVAVEPPKAAPDKNPATDWRPAPQGKKP